MAKLMQEVPVELRGFVNHIEDLGVRHRGAGDAFYDFVEYFVGGLLLRGDQELANRLMKSYGAEYKLFGAATMELMSVYEKMINHGNGAGWYDGLGIVYEILASRRKSQAFGQFFTPPTLCDISAVFMLSEKDNNREGMRTVMDPAAGSGRMLLAMTSKNPKMLAFGADLDPICAKMCAINMALHKIKGESVCMDSLTLKWHFGYYINPLRLPGSDSIPHLESIPSFEDSVFFPRIKMCENAEKEIPKIGEQLSLF